MSSILPAAVQISLPAAFFIFLNLPGASLAHLPYLIYNYNEIEQRIQ